MILKPILCGIALASVGLGPVSAAAAAYLCIEDAVTGFDWEGGKWVHKKFLTTQLLIRKHDPDDPIAFMCHARLKSEGLADSAQARTAGEKVFGCYSQTEVGEEVYFVGLCEERYGSSGALRLIECNAMSSFRFEPNGEYVAWITYAAIESGDVMPETESVRPSVYG